MRIGLLASTPLLLALSSALALAQPAHQGGPEGITCAAYMALSADAQAAFMQGYAFGLGMQQAGESGVAAVRAGEGDALNDDAAKDAAEKAAGVAAAPNDNANKPAGGNAGNMAAAPNAADVSGQASGGPMEPAQVAEVCASTPDALLGEVVRGGADNH